VAFFVLDPLGLAGCPESYTSYAFETLAELSPNGGGRFTPIVPAQDEWSESPRHTDSIQVSGDYGIRLKVDYEDSIGNKGTVKSFHRLSIQKDGFEIISDGQSTKFPLNGRMSKRFGLKPRSTMMNCFTLSTSYRIALECTIATQNKNCVGDFVWKFFVQFSPAGECIDVTTSQHGGHDCDGVKDQAGFRGTAYTCEKLSQ
jgi:hypothetical protein